MKLAQTRRTFGPPRHSQSERHLHQLLIEKPLSTPCKREQRECGFWLDFFFPAWKLAVEVDSAHFHDPRKDAERDSILASAGIVTLRLPNTMPVEQMRSEIEKIAAAILCLALPDKLDYLRSLRDLRQPQNSLSQPEPPTWDRTQYLGNPLCRDCSGDGWKLVPWFSPKLRQAEMRATRCACKNLRSADEPLEFIPSALPEKKPQQSAILFPRHLTAGIN